MTARPLRLRMRGVRKAFAGVPALLDADLDVHGGEVVALIGENGAGKSTLMAILAGAVRADAGSVEVDGLPHAPGGPRAALDRGVHLVHQELQLVDDLSIADNVFLGREPQRGFARRDRQLAEARTRELLAPLGVARHPGTAVRRLALAERQLVEIARGLAFDAGVVALDEPTAALTDAEAARLFDYVVPELRRRGAAIVWISHRLEEIERIAERVFVLRDGRTVARGPVAAFDRRALVAAMVGRDVDEARPHPSAPPRDPARPPALAVTGLADGQRCRGVTLELAEGELLGAFGLAGSGRTELALALLGVRRPTAGCVAVRGVPFAPRDPARALAAGIAYLTEDRKAAGIVPDRPVGENITLAALPRLATRGVLRGVLRRAAERAVVEASWRELGIRARNPAQPIRTLSGGNQQKALIARLLATRAPVLILDEPTRGVDVGAKAEIHDLLHALRARGHSILVISSDLPELLAIADRVVVFRDGRVAGAVERARFSPALVMELAALGEAAHG
ncbi:MAG: sugar ABC transporter ATP-binding protein [Planctomycetes bacterium]|nr:sugar ABC transporter ATP-binding protein [Planctomycetota bacterium]